MFKYLLKTDHSQSSSLAWILLKNIKVYFKEVLTRGKTEIWKQKWKGWTLNPQNEEKGEKKPESKSLTQLFQEGLSTEWENGILWTKSFSGMSIGLSLFLCIFRICRIFQCNFAWIVQNVCSLVRLPSFPFERWPKEII